MAATSINRDAQSDGTTVLRAGACTFTYRRPRPGVLVSVLVSSKSVQLTMAIAQHLSQTGRLMQIYTDPEVYEARRRAG